MANGVSGTRTRTSSGFTQFASMAPEEQAKAINDAKNITVPDYLNNSSDLQKLLYNQGIVGLPDVVSDTELDNTQGLEIFRTVNSVYDDSTGTGLTAPEIAQQVMGGQQTYVASGTMAFHGEGIYFANDRADSENYGYTRGDVNKTCVIRAKIKPSTKIISEKAVVKGYNREIKNNTKLGQALVGASDKRSLYAISKGYQVIYDDYNYYDIIDRSCLVISNYVTEKTKK